MENEHLIPLDQICAYHEIEISFIQSLTDYGLLELTVVEEKPYVLEDQLANLESMIRLHQELDINPEGIEAISHLLKKVKNLQEEIKKMQNKLCFYER